MSRKIQVIVYAPVEDDSPLYGKLRKAIEQAGLAETSAECRSIESLKESLRGIYPYLDIVVLLAFDKICLLEIVSLEALLKNRRVVLILPDSEEDTITWGHSVKPRYLTCVDDNFADLAAVLEKMMKNKSA